MQLAAVVGTIEQTGEQPLPLRLFGGAAFVFPKFLRSLKYIAINNGGLRIGKDTVIFRGVLIYLRQAFDGIYPAWASRPVIPIEKRHLLHFCPSLYTTPHLAILPKFRANFFKKFLGLLHS